MLVGNKEYKTVWRENDTVFLINQNKLPFQFEIVQLSSCSDTCNAISDMTVRGAGAIGVTAAFAMLQAAFEAYMPQNKGNYQNILEKAKKQIEATRPTAQNLFYAVEKVYNEALISLENAIIEADRLSEEDENASKKIGEYGASLISDGFRIETHCNAGWLAFVNYGSALSPIYTAAREGKKVFVYVDETRPRNQGARLTAWELMNEKIDCTIIPDNAGAWYMQQGKIDMMIVGADRIAKNGDTANKIGTLEKAIAAKFYNIPFYIAAPFSTIDFNCPNGKNIPIEERSPKEVLYINGLDENNKLHNLYIAAPGANALNPAFDVTPAELITAFITEKGIFLPNELKKEDF